MTNKYFDGDVLKYVKPYVGFSARVQLGDIFTIVGEPKNGLYLIKDENNRVQVIHESNIEGHLIKIGGAITPSKIKELIDVIDKDYMTLSTIKKFKIGDRVKIVADKLGSNPELRKKYLNATATIIRVSEHPNAPKHIYALEFNNATLQAKNMFEGSWLWSDAELVLLPSTEVIEGDNYKIIIKETETIYVLYTSKAKYFKGIAKLLDGDVYDKEKGIQIAKTKAEIKALEYKLKGLIK